ncbi:hypothetical protein BRC97_03030 [Halobacteriales archaeon QS_6_71_20]|nr:MAG: hypothetical protein BRC97_03030 [Halobacteriales archaeon QS_6_71_20]
MSGDRGTRVRAAVGAGVFLSLLAVWLALRLFDVIDPGPGTAVYLLVGAVVAGAVGGWARASRGLVSPVAVPGVAFFGAAVATWALFVATAPTPADPTPLGWVLLGWPAVVFVGVAGGAAESVLNDREGGE